MLEHREKTLGENHAETGFTVKVLANVFQLQARYEKSETFHKRALRIHEELHGVDAPEVADVLREVLPSDLVEPEPEPESDADTSMQADADAVYVGGVRMDEYGEFVDYSEDETGEPGHIAVSDDEPELPGLTDEAKRLLEVAREELEASGQATVAMSRSDTIRNSVPVA